MNEQTDMFYDPDHPNISLSEWEAFKASEKARRIHYGRRRSKRLRLFPQVVRSLGTRSRYCRACPIT